MFKTFALAALAAVAIAGDDDPSGPTMIQSKLDHYSNDSIVIDQIDTLGHLTMIARGTYADPDPIQTANTENFYVQGIWNDTTGADLHQVHFYCKLQGVVVFQQDFVCSAGDANCPSPAGTAGEDWNGVFGFDVPGFAPPFQYEVHVQGQDASGASLFELESKFYI